MDGIRRLRKVLKYTGLSETTLRRRIQDGLFPAPGAARRRQVAAVGWYAADVKAWVAALHRRAA